MGLRPFLAALLWLAASHAHAQGGPIRVATFNTELFRDGPGLLLRDILKGEAPDIAAAIATIAAAAADIVVLQGVDYDHGGATLAALADAAARDGPAYGFRVHPRPNTGIPTGTDIDGNGYRDGARDAQGYGTYPGQGGLAILSRWPATVEADLTAMLWRDLPGALVAEDDAGLDVQRLSTTAHVVIRVDHPEGPVRLATWHATPPVFDGPEDRNGRRNHDEAAVWLRWLDDGAPEGRFVILGDANLDPVDGDGRPEALRALLSHPALQDPAPASPEGVARAGQGGANDRHRGDPARDTADWDDAADGPGNLRVDYLLPSADWLVTGAGLVWPPVPPGGARGEGSRHALVWADLRPR